MRIWDLEQGTTERVLRGHHSSVRGVAFSPGSGERVASVGPDGTVRLWRYEKTAERGERIAHEDGVLSLAVAPDGQLLATGGADKTVRLWDIHTGETRGLLTGHEHGVLGVAFGPEGKTLASAGSDSSVRLWDVPRARQMSVLRGHTKEIWDVAYGPAGVHLASGGIDGTARLWDPETGEGKVIGAFDSFVYCTAFSPDGKRLAIGGADNLIRIQDLETDRSKILVGHTSALMGVVFDAEGEALASGGWDGTVRIWDLASGRGRVIADTDSWVWGIDLTPDGKRIGAALSDGTARIWDIGSGDGIELRGHRSDVNDFRFADEGRLAVTAGDDGTLRVWDAATGRPVWRAPLMLRSPVRIYTHRGWLALEPSSSSPEPPGVGWREAVEQRARFAAVTEDGRTVCLAGFDGRIEVWGAKEDRRLTEVELNDLSVVIPTPGGCAALAGDELHLVGPDGASARLASGATAIAWDQGEILAAVGSEVRIFDVKGEAGARFEVDPGGTALARVGKWLVVGHREGDIALYPLDETMDRPSYSFEEVPSSPVVRLLAGPMGTVIIGYASGTLGIWKLDNGSLLERMQLHGAVIHLALDENTLYAATELGDLVVWDLGMFHDDYCELLERVWQDVPVVWENGLPVRRVPPTDHGCSRSLD
ncbi:MAG: WD40 repeat domain-containing protein [Deltaproteobacteria bacterium]|nr:WD40 repeat domain-containing protein [Deltaproteobacteria bacterium]